MKGVDAENHIHSIDPLFLNQCSNEHKPKKYTEDKKMLKKMKKLIRSESGQGMVEYGLIIALVAVVAIVGLGLLGGGLDGIFTSITGELGATTPTTP